MAVRIVRAAIFASGCFWSAKVESVSEKRHFTGIELLLFTPMKKTTYQLSSLFLLFLTLMWLGCDPSKSSKPDLAITDLSLNADNFLTVTFRNEGYGPVTKDTGSIQMYVDGWPISGYSLANLANKDYKNVNGSTTITTGIRIGGSNRRIAAVIDPGNVISETNEFQNQVSKTITPPTKNGPDFTISNLSLNASNQLRITVRNIGNQASASNFPVRIRVISDNSVVADLSPNLPAIGVNANMVLSPSPSIPVNSLQSIRVLLNTNGNMDELDGTNNVMEKWLGGNVNYAPYQALLGINKIANSIKWENAGGVRNYRSWTPAEKNDLQNAVITLENKGNPTISAPPALFPGDDISPADAWQIYLAHVAQCLWVDVHNKVSWDLDSYSNVNLELLLDGRKLIRYISSTNRYGFEVGNLGRVTPWNPKVAYEFMSNFGIIQSSPTQTLYKLTDWMRAHLVHISSDDDLVVQYGYAGPPPVDKVLYALEGKEHITAGCWGTTGLYNAMLRTVNIPVESGTLNLGGGTHSRPIFPSLDKSMPHGDDPYTRPLLPSGVPIPTAEIFYSLAEMNSKFIAPTLDCVGSNCNTVGEQASYNHGKDHIELAVALKGDHILYTYATKGAAYMDDYLSGPSMGGSVHLYVKPYFEPAERADMITQIENRLTDLGDGDIEAGKDIVEQRVLRWQNNK
jgi:hypothetical protein